MNSFEITIPSKTFLVGEYAALIAKCGILVNTAPVFKLHVTPSSSSTAKNFFAANSPAQNFINLYPDFFKHYEFKFIDPFNGAGGFGASSAQFVASYAFKLFIETRCQLAELPKIWEMHREYLRVTHNEVNVGPSGLDVISQCLGKITLIDLEKNILEVMNWPFADLKFYLFKTAKKLATHEHLSTLKNISQSSLVPIVAATAQALKNNQKENFLTCIQEFFSVLNAQQFVAESTFDLVQSLKKDLGINTAKGCGAMGIDVFLVCTEKNNEKSLISWAEQHHLRFIADDTMLTTGINIKENIS